MALLVAAGCSTAPGTEPSGGAGGTGASGPAAGGSNAGGSAGHVNAAGGSNAGAGAMSSAGTAGAAGRAAGGASGFAGSSGGAGASGAAGSGTAGSGAAGSGAAGAGQATFAAVASILAMECGKALCHGGAAPAQMLNFTNMATLYTTLTTKVVAECNSEKLVVPGDPNNSALLKLPTWECSDPVAGPFVMPQGCIDDQCLPDQELATFRAWIAAGAPH